LAGEGHTLRGRTVVITGAAGGIGAALARRFAREECRLGLLDRDPAGVEALAQELESAGGSALPLACDVTSPAECDAAMKSVIAATGGIDVLVNNAGITHLGAVRDVEVEVLRRVMEVNFFGSVQCTKAALPSLLERRGQVIVLSSVAGFAPLATRAGYAASKHALEGFFDSLRAEHRQDGDGAPAAAGARTGVRGMVSPEQVADAIVEAAQKGRRLLLVPGRARLAYVVSRAAPALYERLMLRQLRS
jgi:short-subunit dehydrogenase